MTDQQEHAPRSIIAHLVPPTGELSEIAGDLVAEPAAPLPVETWWSWSPQQPYVLRVAIATDMSGQHVTWDIARDLVQAGLVSTAATAVGAGDVAVWSTDTDLHIELDAPSGSALLRWDRSAISAVLAETLHACPNGADLPGTDLDRLLEDLAAAARDGGASVVAEAERVLARHNERNE